MTPAYGRKCVVRMLCQHTNRQQSGLRNDQQHARTLSGPRGDDPQRCSRRCRAGGWPGGPPNLAVSVSAVPIPNFSPAFLMDLNQMFDSLFLLRTLAGDVEVSFLYLATTIVLTGIVVGGLLAIFLVMLYGSFVRGFRAQLRYVWRLLRSHFRAS